MIYSMKSLGKFSLDSRNTDVIIVESPLTAPRNKEALQEAFGDTVYIDDIPYKPLGFELYCLACPVQVGERIGIEVSKMHRL